MSHLVYILLFLSRALCATEQKWRETDDGSKYYIEEEPKYNWFQAWSQCARKNMSLVAIDTLAKHQQLDQLLRRIYEKCPPVWISGHDNANNFLFEWASTGEPFTFTNWGPDQPADTAKGEHCILLWHDFKWHDGMCSTHKLGYICEENQLAQKICHKLSPLEHFKNMNDYKNVFFYFNNGH